VSSADLLLTSLLPIPTFDGEQLLAAQGGTAALETMTTRLYATGHPNPCFSPMPTGRTSETLGSTQIGMFVCAEGR